MKMEARYYVKEGDRIRCELCPHRCVIAKGETGICGVRKHIQGKLVSEKYVRSTGGTVQWDVENDNGDNVASGVYLVILRSDNGERVVRKLMVIR